MKNIHILPTDKPSNLFIIDKSKMFLSEPPYLSFSTVGGKVHKIEGSELYQPQNIYITSDKEIKEGDWFIHFSSGYTDLLRAVKIKEDIITDNERMSCSFEYSHKIILTTDQDLIKYGVQSVPDDFLGWFVKNPNCEEIEIEDNLVANVNINHGYPFRYRIIIPKEIGFKVEKGKRIETFYKEPKQETLEMLEVPMPVYEQETLEEAAKKYSNMFFGDREDIIDARNFAYIEGATRQQEDILKLLKINGYEDEPIFDLINEQFKNK